MTHELELIGFDHQLAEDAAASMLRVVLTAEQRQLRLAVAVLHLLGTAHQRLPVGPADVQMLLCWVHPLNVKKVAGDCMSLRTKQNWEQQRGKRAASRQQRVWGRSQAALNLLQQPG